MLLRVYLDKDRVSDNPEFGTKIFPGGQRLLNGQSDFLNPVGRSEKFETLQPETKQKNLICLQTFPREQPGETALRESQSLYSYITDCCQGFRKSAETVISQTLWRHLKNNNQTNIQHIFKLTPALSRFPPGNSQEEDLLGSYSWQINNVL